MIFFLGVTGTWEGWVPSANDLYLRGNNIAGWTNANGTSFQSGAIYAYGSPVVSLRMGKSMDFSPYSRLNIEFYVQDYNNVQGKLRFRLNASNNSSNNILASVDHVNKPANATVSMNISTINKTFAPYIHILADFTGQIFRIWLS